MMYRIVIAGHLGDGFAAGLHGVSQRHVGRDTVLEGEFVDQAQLHGLLDRLRSLGLEVTNFFTIRPEPDQDDADKKPPS